MDFLIIQETHSTPECEQVWMAEWGGPIIFAHGTSAARGVAILVSKQFKEKIVDTYVDDGRTIICDVIEGEQKITIVAIYAPNEDSPSYFKAIGEILKERSEHKILVGDFNLVLDVELDRENTYCNNNRAKEELENIMDEYSLNEVWRVQNGTKREFSWRKKNSRPLKASRIDFALVSGGLDQKVKMVMYTTSIYTDHRAFYMALEIIELQRGVGYWKLNNTLLQKQEYVSMINREIRKVLEISADQPRRAVWEKTKKMVKKKSLEFSKNQTSEEKLVIAQLSEKIDEYESRLPLTEYEDSLLEKSKAELEEKTLERIKGVMFRSKAKWYEEGERNSKYFFALEKARYNAKTCYKLLTEDGQEIDNQQQILSMQKDFYAELYSTDEGVEFSLQNSSSIRVSKEVRMGQDQQLTSKDLENAIKGMNNNKTPGRDGIPVDFYKVFWSEIKELFYDMMIECYEDSILHDSAREGILNLIPKAKKDTRMIKNLRPITLLNTDYKIIEKAIANKMIPALKEIIHTDQRGFMKDRRISVNIRKMLDIIHEAEKKDLEAVVLSLDFVKCFDKCSFSILHGSLEFFGFGSIVQEWTKILYKDFFVKIQNNGNFSEQISIQKGVHQGGCCSSVYFLVVAEILAIALRNNTDIKGLTIYDIRNLLNQFADDMDVFSLAEEESLKALYNELESFRLQSQ